jgi:hypothetical protein
MSGTGVRTARLKRRARGVVNRARRYADRRRREPIPTLPTIGMVENFEHRQIVGWVTGERDAFPVRVSLHVNDFEVAATWADHPIERNAIGAVRGFRFALADIWKYCKRSDKVTVRMGGQPLPMTTKGIYKRPAADGKLSLADLKKKFSQNYLFGQTGLLQLSKKHDVAWQQSVLDLYRRVGEVVQREYGYQPFAIYGTLLGLVREGGFIGHDIDFDSAYISKLTDGDAVAAELRDVGMTLIEAGFDVECRSTALHVHDPSDIELRIDLFQLFFDSTGRLTFPFGVSTRTRYTTADWQGLQTTELSGRPIALPVNAESLVEHIYGPSWRTPIAGFQWARARTGFQDGILPLEYCEEVYWSNFYARHDFPDGSTFVDFVLSRDDVPDTVLDIGCGDGRDAVPIGRSGRRVHGLDRSQVAIRHAQAAADRAGLGSTLSFAVGDVCDAQFMTDMIRQARQSANGGPVLYYLRFVLQSISEETQTELLTTLAASARAGDMIAAEFRPDTDANTKKTYRKHFRRYQNGAAFGQALRDRYGFEVVHEEENSGLSPYQSEDPVLCRTIGVRR